MKCPFRTTVKTEQLYSQHGTVVTTEFAECLEDECPYFYSKLTLTYNQLRGPDTGTKMACRRCDKWQKLAHL